MPSLLATSRAATPEMAQLPTPQLRTGDFPEGEFIKVENVPVFAEHETTAPDGKPLSFGPAELQAIADRCNRRISETGDYAAICVGHTPTPEMRAMGAQMPDLIGYAGPFRLGRMTLPDGKIRYTILADFAIFKTDFERFKRHPRRSPELWIEDRVEDMFLDPIALLGAEPPRLDMGLVYSMQMHNGRQKLRYSAFASAMNTFTPAVVGAPKRHAAAETGDADMGSAQEVAALVLDAIQELPAWKYIEAQMAEQNTAGEGGAAMATAGGAADTGADPGLTAEVPATPDTMGAPVPAAGAAPPTDPLAAAAPPVPPVDAAAPPAAAVPPAPAADPLAAAVPPPTPPADPAAAGGPLPPVADSIAPPVAAGDPTTDTAAPPVDAPPSEGESADAWPPSDAPADGETASADDDDETKSPTERERLQRYEALDKAMDGMSPEEVEQYMAHRTKRYEAYGEPAQEQIKCTPTVTETSTENVDRYSREYAARGIPMQYAKELAQLNARLDVEHGARVDSERSQELERLAFHDGYVLDPDEEMAVCRYGKMSDAEFADHVKTIRRRYSRSPSGVVLPPEIMEQQTEAADRTKFSDKNRERYSKEAAEICVRSQQLGTRLDFGVVLADVAAGRTGKYQLNGHAKVGAK